MAGDNLVVFYSSDINQELIGHPLSSKWIYLIYKIYNIIVLGDNEFSSDTITGKLQYTTPSLSSLFGLPAEAFSTHEMV